MDAPTVLPSLSVYEPPSSLGEGPSLSICGQESRIRPAIGYKMDKPGV